jgi:hypothetical protein
MFPLQKSCNLRVLQAFSQKRRKKRQFPVGQLGQNPTKQCWREHHLAVRMRIAFCNLFFSKPLVQYLLVVQDSSWLYFAAKTTPNTCLPGWRDSRGASRHKLPQWPAVGSYEVFYNNF